MSLPEYNARTALDRALRLALSNPREALALATAAQNTALQHGLSALGWDANEIVCALGGR